jgi:hypothetical protein
VVKAIKAATTVAASDAIVNIIEIVAVVEASKTKLI